MLQSIVAENFPKYCRILFIKLQPEIRYLDIFAGPGRDADRKPSGDILTVYPNLVRDRGALHIQLLTQ